MDEFVPIPVNTYFGGPTRTFFKWLHKTWGDNIQWLERDKTLVGWLTLFKPVNNVEETRERILTNRLSVPIDLPKEGDEIWGDMASGAIGKYRVIKSEWMKDPEDMFIVDVKFKGHYKYAPAFLEDVDLIDKCFAIVDVEDSNIVVETFCKEKEMNKALVEKSNELKKTIHEVLF